MWINNAQNVATSNDPNNMMHAIIAPILNVPISPGKIFAGYLLYMKNGIKIAIKAKKLIEINNARYSYFSISAFSNIIIFNQNITKIKLIGKNIRDPIARGIRKITANL